MSSDYYLELSNNPIRFEAVNQLTNVFFDDSNKHVFAVRSGGVMGVIVKGPNDQDKPLNFRMEDHGPVVSIKFSLDQKILAVQRSNVSVEFMNFDGTNLDLEYSQNCKKNSNILGFVWIHTNQVAFITNHGIELYMIIPDKKSLKHLKTASATAEWFVWCSVNKIALLSSGHGSQLQPIVFKPNCINKLPKVETEPGRMALERDITLSTLYGVPAVLILRHQSGPQAAEVHVHTLTGPGQAPIKAHVLKLGLSGRFAINIVDELILVHHQASRSSQVFDTALPGESDGNIKYHNSVAPARSIRPTSLSLPGLVEPQTHQCELYSPNWVVFQPNIVIDAKLGCLWHINLCLNEFLNAITDLSVCTQIALNRNNGKSVLLKLLLNNIRQEKPLLDKLQESFNYINNIYRDWVEFELQSHTAVPANAPLTLIKSSSPRVVIDQMNIYNEILQQLDYDKEYKKLEWTLIAYMTSLSERGILAQHALCELLITTMVKQNKFTSLLQLIQHGLISDTKPIACLLLSLGNMHPSTYQLALDMLARLNAKDEIQEILLSQGQVLSALKFCPNNLNARKFLQAAQNTNDKALFHSVLYYLKNNPQYSEMFKKDERLHNFVQEYNSIFIDQDNM